MTAGEIRARILSVTQRNGGHLASSLGAVEIALALSEVFDPLRDRIVWDVGHQAYAWKILTGRNESFDTLRQFGGLSGFPNPAESAADAAVAGHAGVSISVAEGLAAARDRRGTREHVVAVVGDAALANGTSFEALNNCANATNKVIVVLNDNEMSISTPVGSLARLLGRVITNVRYNRVKAAAEKTGHRLRLTFLRTAYHKIESRIKGLFLGNRFFEQFGLRYIGPVDGHDLAALRAAFTVAKEDKRNVVVHVVTKKGRGFAPAEQDPTRWHGIGPASASAPAGRDWSAVCGAALCAAARRDARIVALTAGMKHGTGLAGFADEFPTRFFDVGISEGHLVAFAAGLAGGGLRPVVAIYSTFLQRAIDQVMHDVCIARLPVIFCVDRAGVVGADGATHQGVFDLAMLRSLPNLTICQPRDAEDFRQLLDEALARPGPTVIRYPRGLSPEHLALRGQTPEFWGQSPADSRGQTPDLRGQTPQIGGQAPASDSRGQTPQIGGQAPASVDVLSGKLIKTVIWTTGDWYRKACAVADRIGAEVVQARYLKPVDGELLARQRAAGWRIVSLENGVVIGGLGDALGADVKFGWPDEFVPHGTVAELEKKYGLDVDSIVLKLEESVCASPKA